MRHTARLAKLEQEHETQLRTKIAQLQQQGDALYMRMPPHMQAVLGRVCDLVVAADDAGAVQAWQNVITDSPEWRALWVEYDRVCDALAACGAYYGGPRGTKV